MEEEKPKIESKIELRQLGKNLGGCFLLLIIFVLIAAVVFILISINRLGF